MTPTDPPFVDEHAIVVARPLAEVWAAVDAAATRDLARTERNLVDLLWGTESPGGFHVGHRIPGERIALEGRHRFSRYRLELLVRPVDDGATRLAARTYATFDGPHGRLYRLLVIGTRLHVVATRRLLRSIGHRSADRPGAPPS